MPQKSLITSEQSLKVVSLPQHGETYTVVSHGYIIDETRRQLEDHGFEIKTEMYNSNINGEVAQGVYHLSHATDPELGLMFAWANSYDKTMRFRCAIGGYVFVCSNGIIAGDMSNYGRKHVGEAKDEVKSHILQQVASAQNYYDELVKAKEKMKNITVSDSDLALLMGKLYFVDSTLTSSQLIIVKNQFKAPAFDYGTDADSLWTVYNHITYALKQSHPKTWMEDQKALHKTVKNLFLSKVETEEADPNQLSLLDQVNETVEVEDVLDMASPEVEIEEIEEVEEADIEDTTLNENISFSLDDYLEETNQEDVLDELVSATVEEVEEVEPEVKTDETGLFIIDDVAEFQADVEMQEIKTEEVYDLEEVEELDEVTGQVTGQVKDLDAEEDEDWNKLEEAGVIAKEVVEETPVVEAKDTKPFPLEEATEEDATEMLYGVDNGDIEITNAPINILAKEENVEESTDESPFEDFVSSIKSEDSSNNQSSSEEESPFEF
jgi:hypothetical protein